MNPIQITRHLQIEFTRHNAGIDRAKRSYYDDRVDLACNICTDKVTCGKCRYKARQYLKVATSQDECASLLAVIARDRVNAAECGTVGGYKLHRRHDEKPCLPCRDAQNAFQRANRLRKKAER